MNDFRPLGAPIRPVPEAETEVLRPVNRSGTVVTDKGGRFQTRAPLPGPRFPPIETDPE